MILGDSDLGGGVSVEKDFWGPLGSMDNMHIHLLDLSHVSTRLINFWM